jgi:very-short-patch-repair endonuclease/SAM-dependent methyltransferase
MRIRGRQLGGFKFVRQEPIGRYYVDFVCRERRVIVELDGGQHSENPEDRLRDSELSALGYRVIRIWNNDITENADGVLQMLLSELENCPSPQPSPRERGEGDNAVRAFYESHPYPAPLRDLDRHRELYNNPDRRWALSLLMWPTEEHRPDREILVAGCGTSQAAVYALREPDAHVTAIDISETSLSHTRELQQKYGLRNLDLHRLAIEEVGQLGQTFDQIACTGVLHHLPDPDIGLRSLRNALARDGAMQLMVYAAYGRTGIYMMQEYCRLLEVGVSDQELRDLGTTIGALSADHPIAGVSRRTKDFTYPDALADALLHPQDRAYTVPQLYAWLKRCGLSFGRWFDQAPYLPQCGAIARLPHSAQLKSLAPPLQHTAVELLRGTMTKHNFIAYRDDHPGDSQPITFDGDAWRGWVPLRLPWTLCIRDRAPPGASAVLINRSHTYPDLALPIDAANQHVFDAIDGKRSVDEILRDAAGKGGHERGRRFFQQLWEYDQIVFDATASH